MGNNSCSSLPDLGDKVDIAVCKEVLGDDFNLEVFNANKSKKIGANYMYKSKLVELINTTDCFLSFCWGRDSAQRDNLERVARIHELLAQNDINTWFEDERKFDTLTDKLERGAVFSACVVVFLTARYMDKIAGKGPRKELDDTKIEFDFCVERILPENMIIVLMEDSLKDLSQWPTGNVSKFWNHEIIDYSGSLVDIEDKIDILVSAIRTMKEKKRMCDDMKYVNKNGSRDKLAVVEKGLSDSLKVFGLVLADGVYHGYISDAVSNTPHGKGSYVYFFGESYEGDWVYGEKHGHGKLKWDDGGVYEGSFVNNERQGRGILKDPKNNIYDGEWFQNKPHGMGMQKFSNNDVYEGSWKDGKMNGNGRYTWSVSKAVYEGMFQDNVKVQKGKLSYSDGGYYEGDMANNTLEGKGTFSWPNGNHYNGQFSRGRFVHGVLYIEKVQETYLAIFTDTNESGDGTEISGTLNCRAYDVVLKSAGSVIRQGRFCNGDFCPTPEEISERELQKRLVELERIRQIEEAKRRRRAEMEALVAKAALEEKLKKQTARAEQERLRKQREAAVNQKAREDKREAKRLKRLEDLKIAGVEVGDGVASLEAADDLSIPSIQAPIGPDFNDELSVGSLDRYQTEVSVKKRRKKKKKKRKKKKLAEGDVPPPERKFSKISLENKIADYKERIDFDEGEYYDGEIRTGKYFKEFWLHGHGEYHWRDGSSYVGDWYKDKMHGVGKQVWPDGTSYEGDYHSGLRHGRGTMTTSDGHYQGQFLVGKKHGEGLQMWTDGSNYQGSFINGKKEGKGILTLADGGTYEGDWERGKRHGVGSQRWADGSTFFGDFECDLFSGNGFYAWSDGATYDGEFKCGMKDGKGKQVWLSGSSYEGYYSNDKKHGFGTFTFKNGSLYKGEFLNDKKSGKGVYKWKDGSYYDGDYYEDKKHGFGTIRWANGNTYEGIFKHNLLSTGTFFLKSERTKYKAVFTLVQDEKDIDSSSLTYHLELKKMDTYEVYKDVKFSGGRVICSAEEEQAILAEGLSELARQLPSLPD